MRAMRIDTKRHYRPQVVLIHGLSIPAIVFHRVVPLLTAANYRVLIYDLYGRGYSDAPQLTYDPALYATQLALLMQHIKWDNAKIAGLSMGGGIAAYFTQAFPWLVDGKVALLASSGLMQVRPSIQYMSPSSRFSS
jgi:pimeloyl-ACP methyl ester carboxylesterase